MCGDRADWGALARAKPHARAVSVANSPAPWRLGTSHAWARCTSQNKESHRGPCQLCPPGLERNPRSRAKGAPRSASQVVDAAASREAIDAERQRLATPGAGVLSYYCDECGDGRPVLLVHAIHAAASSYEMRNLFESLRAERRVYALDLPGFGFSQRGGMPYSWPMYQAALSQMLDHISNLWGEPVDIIASSLSCEYAAAVAACAPERVASLVLLSPTGFEHPTRSSDAPYLRPQPSRGWQTLVRAAGVLLYDMLTTRPSLALYLRRSFAGPVDPDLLEYAYATSHQLGAHCAPLAFVQGDLFPAADPQRIYASVTVPVLVLYDEDPYTSFDGLRVLGRKARRASFWRNDGEHN